MISTLQRILDCIMFIFEPLQVLSKVRVLLVRVPSHHGVIDPKHSPEP